MLVGDWDCVENANLDRFTGREYQQNLSILMLKNLITIANAVDIFRESHYTDKLYTFKKGLESVSRIDRIYLDRLLALLVFSINYRVGIGKDYSHSLTITLHTASRLERGK